MSKSTKRLDGVDEIVTKQVEVSKLVQPKFLTLTEKPANQVAFKVVRDDKGEEPNMTKTSAVATEGRRHRIRSTKRSSLLYIEFPEGTTADEAKAAMEEYGLEDYELVQDGDKVKCKRSDLAEIPANAITVQIGEGRKAGILRSEVPVAEMQDTMPNISVVAIEFKNEVFATTEAVMAYLTRHDIDFLEKGVENTDSCIRVTRSEYAEDAELRRVEVETGVVAVVTRAEISDIVDAIPFIEVVSESAYGQWGWGQLDFGARMADVEFCESAEEATSTLRRVVEDILFYSQLPVSVRKELVIRAASQFSAYVGSLLDALPAKVVLLNRSNLEKLKEHSMTQKTEVTGAEGQIAERKDDATATPEVKTEATQDDNTPVTRSELKSIIGEAVSAALAAQATPAKAEETKRSDEEVKDSKEGDKADGESNTLKAVEEVVTRSVGGLADAVKTIGDRLTAIEGATTVRSDGVDSATSQPKDPFVGIFSHGRK